VTVDVNPTLNARVYDRHLIDTRLIWGDDERIEATFILPGGEQLAVTADGRRISVLESIHAMFPGRGPITV
jgi:hypothetical protein